MLLERIKLKNLLSFGPKGVDLELRKLNVLIGPNGSGKSNLIEAISLLQAMPRDLAQPFREGGGIHDWLWRGNESAAGQIETIVEAVLDGVDIRHNLVLGAVNHQLEVLDEAIEDAVALPGHASPYDYYHKNARGRSRIRAAGRTLLIQRKDLDSQQSILEQRKDPKQYAAITALGEYYRRIAIYRDWPFGRENPARQPQQTDLRTDHLEPNCRNLALTLNRLGRKSETKRQLVQYMKDLLDGLKDYSVDVLGGTAQLLLEEYGGFSVPASRLSDGTLRFLALLVILLDPDPPPLVCMDEPELGLHPDLVVTVGKLLVDASRRMQLIVTTHSGVLVDALHGAAEDVVVCQRREDGSEMRRLSKRELKIWLGKYPLSELWSSGQIGGNRW
jgi:predicted ATPase